MWLTSMFCASLCSDACAHALSQCCASEGPMWNAGQGVCTCEPNEKAQDHCGLAQKVVNCLGYSRPLAGVKAIGRCSCLLVGWGGGPNREGTL